MCNKETKKVKVLSLIKVEQTMETILIKKMKINLEIRLELYWLELSFRELLEFE
jgi:hypothetical protein